MIKALEEGSFGGIARPGPNGGCIRIPRYQRSFGWTNIEAHVLARDIHILSLSGEADPQGPHWMGPIVIKDIDSGPNRCAIGTAEKGRLSTEANHTCQEIIDGQQRLATLALLWKAIWDHSNSVDFAGELSTENKDLQLPDLSLQKSDESAYKRIFVHLNEEKTDFGNLREDFDELQKLDNPPEKTRISAATHRDKKREYGLKVEGHTSHNLLLGEILADGSAFCRVYVYFRFLLWLGRKSFDEDVPEGIKPPTAKKPTAEKPRAEKPLESFLIKRFQAHLDTQRKKDGNPPFTSIFTPGCECPNEKPHKCPPDPDDRVDLDKLLETTLKKLEYAVIRIDENEDGSKVYDTLNGRRLELDQYDHLKSYCFSHFATEEADEIFKTYWEPAEETIDRIAKGKTGDSIRDRFLYEHAISIGEGSVSGFSKGRSFSAFRDYLQRRPGPETLEKWVKEDFPAEAIIFAFVLEPKAELKVRGVTVTFEDSTRRAMVRLNLASSAGVVAVVSTLVRRRILQERNGLDPNGISEEGFRNCLRAIEGILYLTPLTGNALTFVRPWVIGLMEDIEECSGTSDMSAEDQILKKIQDSEKLPTWKDLRNYLLDDYLEKDGYKGPYQILRSSGCLALLDAIGEELDPAHGSPVVSLERGGQAWSVDHIFPRDDTNWKGKASPKKLEGLTTQLEQIGNLAPVPLKDNKSVGNKSFQGKTQHLKGKWPKGSTIVLCGCYESPTWTGPKIKARSKQMAGAIKMLWYPE